MMQFQRSVWRKAANWRGESKPLVARSRQPSSSRIPSHFVPGLVAGDAIETDCVRSGETRAVRRIAGASSAHGSGRRAAGRRSAESVV